MEALELLGQGLVALLFSFCCADVACRYIKVLHTRMKTRRNDGNPDSRDAADDPLRPL